MYISPDLPLICPLDGNLLLKENNSLCCEAGHSFDIAKQGYVNLLPVHYKKSKEPGDSKEMIAARSRFLEAGFYDQISACLNEIVLKHISGKGQANILDAGCGEGFYLNRCHAYLRSKLPELKLSSLGLDISKPGIVAAAKRNKDICWVVGTNKSPPVEPESIDVVFCMFGFCDLSVMSKILKPAGLLLLVDPGPEHLLALRHILYPTLKESSPRDDFIGFNLIDQYQLHYDIEPHQEQIADLLRMTPHLYRASKEGKEAVFKLQLISLSVDVIFYLLQRL